MSAQAKVALDVSLVGNAKATLKETARAARELATIATEAIEKQSTFEERLNSRLKSRLSLLQQLSQIKPAAVTALPEVARAGGARAAEAKAQLSDEEKYQQKLAGTLQRLKEKERLKADVAKALGTKEPTQEEQYQAKLASSLQRLQEKQRLKSDIDKASGVKEPTDEEKYQAKLAATLGRLQEKARIKADIDRAAGAKELSAEEKYQQKLEQTRQRLLERQRLKVDLEQHGPSRPAPTADELYQQKLQKRLASRAESRQLKADVDKAEGTVPRPSLTGNLGQLVQLLRTGKLPSLGGGSAASQAAKSGIGDSIGGLTKLGIVAAGVAGTIAAMGKVMEKTSQIINIQKDKSLTESERSRKTAEALPVVGGFAKQYNDLIRALDGTAESIRKSVQELPIALAGIQASSQGRLQEAGIYREQRNAQGYARALNLMGGVSIAHGDRSTYMGAIQDPFLQRKGSAIDAAEVATARAMAAKQGINVTAGQFGRAQEAYKKAVDERNLAQGQYDRVKNGDNAAKSIEAATKWRVAEAEVTARLKELDEARSAMQKAQVDSIQKESDARKANLEIAKVDLDYMQQKEQRLSQQAAHLGMMSRGQRQQLAFLAEREQKVGWDRMSPRQREMLGAFNPLMAQKEAERAGLNDPALARLKGAGWADKGDLSKVRMDVDKLADQIRQGLRDDENRFAKSMSGIMKEFASDMATIIKDTIKQAKRELEADLQRQQRIGGNS